MRIVPVLDLMGGVVVHGRGGRREATTEPLTDARTGRLSAITPEP